MRVSEVMNKIFIIDPKLSLKKAAEAMSKYNIGSLVVVEKNKPVGIITDKDIIQNIDHLDKKVFSAMTKNVITINKNAEFDEAAALMDVRKVKRLPVVTDNGKLVGIVTITDIVANSEMLNDNPFG
jgi:CBS domain-containing protein